MHRRWTGIRASFTTKLRATASNYIHALDSAHYITFNFRATMSSSNRKKTNSLSSVSTNLQMVKKDLQISMNTEYAHISVISTCADFNIVYYIALLPSIFLYLGSMTSPGATKCNWGLVDLQKHEAILLHRKFESSFA